MTQKQHIDPERFFDFNGILPADAPSYVVRPADDAVLSAVHSGHLCWVTAPHHFGKSSLAVRLAHILRVEGMQPVIVTYAGSGGSATDTEQLFLLLLRRLRAELKLVEDVNAWWLAHGDSPFAERLTVFLRDVVLRTIENPLVLFIDGLNEDLNREFVSAMFDALAILYGERSRESKWQRINVVLLGRALPESFGLADTTLPLAGAVKVSLDEIPLEMLAHFRQVFPEATDREWELVARHVFSWTEGHPYLTQRLLSQIARMWDNRWTIERIDDLVDTLFLLPPKHAEPNLRFIVSSIETAPSRKKLLKLYNRILSATSTVPVDTTDARQRLLVGSGLVAVRDGSLVVRNQIYRAVFNREWVKSFAPTNWRFVVLVSIIFACLLIGLSFSVSFRQQEITATEARTYIENVRQASNPSEKLINLAGLFRLERYKNEARQLAFDELSRDELLAILSPMNVETVSDDMVTVIRGLYTAPQLLSADDADEILTAIRQPLQVLEQNKTPGAVELNLEIGQWLRGREFYRGGQFFQRAIDSYNISLTINQQNPGVYYDRALAYAALGQVNDALNDLEHVRALDDSWGPLIQKALLDDPVLYATLWNNRQNYAPLIALAPSPTPTPTATATAVATDTPVPPPTSAPATDTPTATPSPLPTATSTPTATFTPRPPTATPRRTQPTPTRSVDVLSGTFTLVDPITTDPPTYGNTEFRWRWSGGLPTGYGFEIRVWADGEPPLGAHDAVRDNQTGAVKFAGGDEYRLVINIKDAAGVRQRSGEYNWAVALIQYQPAYKDLGIVSPPARLRFEVPSSGGGGGSGGGNNGGGGGVGIE